jgi:hypothetical protein
LSWINRLAHNMSQARGQELAELPVEKIQMRERRWVIGGRGV